MGSPSFVFFHFLFFSLHTWWFFLCGSKMFLSPARKLFCFSYIIVFSLRICIRLFKKISISFLTFSVECSHTFFDVSDVFIWLLGHI
jgi:hypothetical protein